jgi:hypothetical protein
MRGLDRRISALEKPDETLAVIIVGLDQSKDDALAEWQKAHPGVEPVRLIYVLTGMSC